MYEASLYGLYWVYFFLAPPFGHKLGVILGLLIIGSTTLHAALSPSAVKPQKTLTLCDSGNRMTVALTLRYEVVKMILVFSGCTVGKNFHHGPSGDCLWLKK